ncbi:MAG: isoprenylcysteine carboxylmethyltransferase family protein [Desulfomonilia bacterium]|jgi:protein-S-isoprenylcysteine O-methyltransferase Ste14|nr:isoprenylcysteine carboxylmethyltransferase family protein [Desulfomonilia bacterium]
MMLRDLIQKQGEVLFRYRGYAPLLLAPAVLFALQDSEWIEHRFGDFFDDVYDWCCLGISMAGVALRTASVGYVPRRTSGRNTKKGQVADELNMTGMYSIVRHPLYLANMIIMIGFLLATGSIWLTAVCLLACCLHYERVACAEESFLMENFGARYQAWANRTPAFLPKPSLWVPPARGFCWRTALKREYLTVFGVIAAFTLLDYAEDLLALGRIEFETETTVLFVCSLCAFLLIRYLRKKTRLLHIDGR